MNTDRDSPMHIDRIWIGDRCRSKIAFDNDNNEWIEIDPIFHLIMKILNGIHNAHWMWIGNRDRSNTSFDNESVE